VTVEYIGFAAGCLTVASFVPQVRQTWKTHRVRDLSLGTFSMLFTGAALWLAYGIASKDWPVILTNTGVLLMNAAILVAKVRFKDKKQEANQRT